MSIEGIVFDCARPSSLARFWCDVLMDYEIAPYDEAEIQRLRAMGIEDVEDDPSVCIRPKPNRTGPQVWFTQVPEPKSGKNRVHIDVKLRDRRHLERLIGRGAFVVHTFDHEDRVVLADPEGNEFCALLPSVR